MRKYLLLTSVLSVVVMGATNFAWAQADAEQAQDGAFVAPPNPVPAPPPQAPAPPPTVSEAPAPTPNMSGDSGQLSAANPDNVKRIRGPLTNLSAQAGVGGGFGVNSQSVLWGIGADYKFLSRPMTDERWVAKALFDINFATGSDSSRFLDAGVGANYYLGDYFGLNRSRAFGTADFTVANATDGVTSDTVTSAGLGVGMSYTVARTNQADIDILLHYTLLLAGLDGSIPSLLTARLGFGF